jgi:hypothetical protein
MHLDVTVFLKAKFAFWKNWTWHTELLPCLASSELLDHDAGCYEIVTGLAFQLLLFQQHN